MLGPNIAAPAGRSVAGLGIPETAGAFVWGAAVFLLTALLMHLLLRPDPLLTARALAAAEQSATDAEKPEGPGKTASAGVRSGKEDRSLRAGFAAVAASPQARLAVVTIAAAHTAMVSIMVMTPVDLGHHGAGIELIGMVISAHIVGMYAFSPVMGLARRPLRTARRHRPVPSRCCRARPHSRAPRTAITSSRQPVCSCSASAGRRGWSPARRC